jgi:hypothetical protein
MTAPKMPLPAFRRLAPWLALAAACVLPACMDAASATGPRPSQEASSAQTSAEKKVSRPGVPDGCNLEWSSAKRDSVLYCPDLPPPSPR